MLNTKKPPTILKSIYRSYTCGELRIAHVNQEVTLSGWIMRKRDHGGVFFVDLRDHYGLTQVVFSGNLLKEIETVRLESVVCITGIVKARGSELINPKLATGEIEIAASSFRLLSPGDILPFQIADDDGATEPVRLRYRFLELRREELHKNIILRSQVIRAARDIMHELGFQEFQTPILTSSSPEGARDFIVPSRLHPGKFYALPQAPQQFKQLLMVAGFDRYFQIAPCFRDEDARADRSPGEFYQIDIEMSFVEQKDVLHANECLFSNLFPRFSSWEMTKTPFPRLSYREAMTSYGSDKPDLRNPLVIENISEIFSGTQFKVFGEALARKESIYAIKVEGEIPSRKYLDDTVEFFRDLSGKGLIYLIKDGETVKGTLAKFISSDEVNALKTKLSLGSGTVFFTAGEEKDLLPALGKLRIKLGQDLGKTKKETWAFCWVLDFPFYELDSEGTLTFGHNPFSMPHGGLKSLCEKPPLEILAYQHDLVLNGHELASGAIRNHQPEVMYKAFELVGYGKEVVEEKFGGMIRAFQFGAPPHGGIAHGIDRIVMLLAGEDAIREVIAFPLAQNGEDLLMGAPSTVSEKQLREAHIKLRGEDKK